MADPCYSTGASVGAVEVAYAKAPGLRTSDPCRSHIRLMWRRKTDKDLVFRRRTADIWLLCETDANPGPTPRRLS
jgi:hypothetical protein